MAPQWQVERRHLAAGIARAALAWRDALERLGAEVLAGEAWLQGTWAGIPIHGQADLILGLPEDRLVVVDYKRSKSAKRREQMEKGYDSQANLYRTMLQTGGLKNDIEGPSAERLRRASAIGTVYYMMNDQTGLADTALPGPTVSRTGRRWTTMCPERRWP
jgi:ATP-dependent helicase/nuclease subunit B